MRIANIGIAWFALCCGFIGGQLQAQEEVPLESIDSLSESISARVVAWRRDFHQNPELSNREFRTAGIVAEHLAGLGMDVQTGIAHTGVVGTLKGGKPGPVVLLRADMDGLPVPERNDLPFRSQAVGEYNGEQVPVMHACGHDSHVAIMMGVAEILSELRDELPGTVKFVFQPAEEGAPKGEEGGAELMVAEGILKNPDVDAAFALHVSAVDEAGQLGFAAGPRYASVDDFKIIVHGVQAHGASPWLGVDSVVVSAQIINALQTIVSRNLELTEQPGIVTVGSIHGGLRSNIIPEKVEMVGTIRALDDAMRSQIHQRIREIAEGVAQSMGATVEVHIPWSNSYPVTYNDPELAAEMYRRRQKGATHHRRRRCFLQRQRGPGILHFTGRKDARRAAVGGRRASHARLPHRRERIRHRGSRAGCHGLAVHGEPSAGVTRSSVARA